MKLIFTLYITLLFCDSYAQQNSLPTERKGVVVQCIPYNIPNLKVKIADSPIKVSSSINIKHGYQEYSSSNNRIFFTCGAGRSSSVPPIYIINGVVVAGINELKKLDPNEIVSIDILKESELSFFSCYNRRGAVVLITTKQSKLQQFVIKDFLDGNPIPAATVSFISMDKKDTVMIAANDSGVVVTNQLKRFVSYEVKVSAIGYKLLDQYFKISYNKIPQELLLERTERFCTEVILNSGHYHGCPRYYCTRKISECSMQIVSDTTYPIPNILVANKSFVQQVFPNPAQRGNTITIKTEISAAEQVLIKLSDLGGKLVLSQPQYINKGLSRITLQTDSRWAAGIYLLHIYAKGKLLASDKIIIQ